MTTRHGLTPEQARLLAYIAEFCDREGHSPSYQQMAGAMGLASKSGVHRLIEALHERGCIHRLPNRARSIEVVNASRFAPHIETALVDAIRETGIARERFIEIAVAEFVGVSA